MPTGDWPRPLEPTKPERWQQVSDQQLKEILRELADAMPYPRRTGFRAYQQTAQVIAGTPYRIILDAEEFDDEQEWDSGGSVWAPRHPDEPYLVGCGVQPSGANEPNAFFAQLFLTNEATGAVALTMYSAIYGGVGQPPIVTGGHLFIPRAGERFRFEATATNATATVPGKGSTWGWAMRWPRA